MNTRIFAFLGVLTVCATLVLPLPAQWDKSFGADRTLNDDLESERWSMQWGGPKFRWADVQFLERDSLVSVAVNDTNRVINYYSGQVLHTTPMFYNIRQALHGGERYLWQAEPSVEPNIQVVGRLGFLIRADMQDNFRLDTVVFNTFKAEEPNTERFFDGVQALPGDDHRVIIRMRHKRSSGNDCCDEWGSLLLYDNREALPDGWGPLVGSQAQFNISPDGKYCVSGGVEAVHDRTTSYVNHYNIWRVDEDELTHHTHLNDYVRTQFDPRARFLLVWNEDRFVQRYVFNAAEATWRGVHGFRLEPLGQLTSSGDNWVQFNRERAQIETIDLSNGKVRRECGIGDCEDDIVHMGLSPHGDVVILVGASGTVAALNLCGVGRPPLPFGEVKRAEDTPQLLPDALNMQSLGGGVHRIGNSGAQRGTLFVHNLMGQQVFRTEMNGKTTLDLNTAGWPRGVYFVTRRGADVVEQSTILITD